MALSTVSEILQLDVDPGKSKEAYEIMKLKTRLNAIIYGYEPVKTFNQFGQVIEAWREPRNIDNKTMSKMRDALYSFGMKVV